MDHLSGLIAVASLTGIILVWVIFFSDEKEKSEEAEKDRQVVVGIDWARGPQYSIGQVVWRNDHGELVRERVVGITQHEEFGIHYTTRLSDSDGFVCTQGGVEEKDLWPVVGERKPDPHDLFRDEGHEEFRKG